MINFTWKICKSHVELAKVTTILSQSEKKPNHFHNQPTRNATSIQSLVQVLAEGGHVKSNLHRPECGELSLQHHPLPKPNNHQRWLWILRACWRRRRRLARFCYQLVLPCLSSEGNPWQATTCCSARGSRLTTCHEVLIYAR